MARATWSRLFPGHPAQIRQVRAYVGAVLDGRTCREVAQLVACELATNALQHTASGGPDGWFVVHLSLNPHRVRVGVHDLGHPHNTPALREATAHTEAGRGLLLTCALSTAWGATRSMDGHLVWADVPDDF